MFDGSRGVMVVGGTFHQESHTHSPGGPSVISGFERLLQATSPSAFHNSGKRFDSPRCHPNTRLEALKRIGNWIDRIDDCNSSIMWLNGDAGIGKSAIAQTLAERLAEEGRLLASYFFSRTDPTRNNTRHLIASIAYHIALHIPQIKKHVIQAVDSNPLIFELSLADQFSALVTKPICNLARSGYFTSPLSPRIIILDGLDECEDPRSQVLILNVIVTALKRDPLPLLFFISTCPEQHLSIEFASDPMIELSVSLQLKLDDAANEIQIIDVEQEFLSGLGDQMVKWSMNNVGSEYEVVAIIGSQSSGKSTLLNSLFGTNFVVMDPSSRGRTTSGIWLSHDKGHNLIIMDVEGSDGASRGDDQQFERKSALFALACSRLLIINIWENQVGLHNGANMGLLKIVFEEYLFLYGKLDRRSYHWPRILFVIQAHASDTSLASLARTITLDLNRIWESIEKPEEMRDGSPQDYFHFEFESITHMRLAAQVYKSQVELLHKRFVEKESTNYLLKDAFPNSVAADGLELYMKMIWETIRANENLSLAGQYELLSRAMCDKIWTSLLDEYRPMVSSQLDILNEGTVIDGLGLLMENWKSEILARYDERAHRYVQSILAEKRNQLIYSYHVEVSRLFSGQLRNLRLSLLAAFDVVLGDAVFKESNAEFVAIISNAKDRYEDDFTTAIRNTTLSDANWDWEHDFQELRSSLTQRMEACKNERVGSSPIQVSKNEWVGSNKSITTTATQYRDGRLIVEARTDCDENFHGLRGRILVVVNDIGGTPIGVTNELRCTTRGGLWDLNTPSSGKDVFSLKFPREIGMRAASLDIHQTDEKSLTGILQNIIQVTGAVIAA